MRRVLVVLAVVAGIGLSDVAAASAEAARPAGTDCCHYGPWLSYFDCERSRAREVPPKGSSTPCQWLQKGGSSARGYYYFVPGGIKRPKPR